MSQCSMFKSCCFDEVKSSNGVDVVNTTVNQREAFESAISVIMVIRPESISQSQRLKTKPNIVTMAIFESVIRSTQLLAMTDDVHHYRYVNANRNDV